MQLGLAGAVATHGVDVHAGGEQVRGEDGGVGLVGGHGGDNVGTLHSLGGAAAHGDGQATARQVAYQLGTGAGIHIEHPQVGDAHQMPEGQRLELALRPVANQCHHPAAGAGQRACGQRRGGGGAQRGGQRQLAHQQRCARGHIGQHTKRHHRGQAVSAIAGVAVDVFEGVLVRIGNRHQLDHAHFRMRGHAGGLVKVTPAQKVLGNGIGHLAQAHGQADAGHQLGHIGGAEKAGGQRGRRRMAGGGGEGGG